MECPNCHQYVTDGTPFCVHCGSPLSSPATTENAYAESFSQYPPSQPMQDPYAQPSQAYATPMQDAYAQPAQNFGQPQDPYGQAYQPQQQGYPYGQAPQTAPYMPMPQTNPANGKAIGSLVCGIIGILMLCGCPFVSIILGIVAIILGVSADKVYPDGKSKAGKIMGIITLVLSVILSVLTAIAVVAGTSSPVPTITDLGGEGTTGFFENNESVEGTWYISEMVTDGEVVGADSIDLIYSMGIELTIELEPGGQANINLYDETESGSWSYNNGEVVLSFNGESITGTMNGDKLVLRSADGSTEMTLSRENRLSI